MIGKSRGVKGAASWCAMAVMLYLVCRTCLRAVVSALMNWDIHGASLENPIGFSQVSLQLFNLLIGALAIALPVLWLLKTTRLEVTDLRLSRPAPWSPGFCALIFLGLANAGNIISGLLSRLMGIPGTGVSLPAEGPALAAAILALCFLPAIGEELLFRGALQGLMRPCGSLAAIVAPALLFALLHLNLPQFIPAFLSGLFLGWLTERTGSIIPGMLLHLLNNALAAFDLYLQLYAPENYAIGIELFILIGFPLAGAWMLWRAARQGFSFADGMRPGARLSTIFTSPAYLLAAAFLAFYTIWASFFVR